MSHTGSYCDVPKIIQPLPILFPVYIEDGCAQAIQVP